MNTTEDRIETTTISSFDKFTRPRFDGFVKDMYKLITSAEETGYTDVYITFNSTHEPYENDILGDVQVEAYGKRPLNKQEITRQKEEDEINALAKKLGITFYEANTIRNLQSRGKLKDL